MGGTFKKNITTFQVQDTVDSIKELYQYNIKPNNLEIVTCFRGLEEPINLDEQRLK